MSSSITLAYVAQEFSPWDSKRRPLIATMPVGIELDDSMASLPSSYLPGYGLDFDPVERLWLGFNAYFFSDSIAGSAEELTQRFCHALTSLKAARRKSPFGAPCGNNLPGDAWMSRRRNRASFSPFRNHLLQEG
jgi:hypothetical protein